MAKTTNQSAEAEADDGEVLTIGDDVPSVDTGKKKKALIFDEESTNLVAEFKKHPDGRKALQEIGLRVVSDFETAWDSTEEYRAKTTENWKMFVGDLPKKTGAFKDAANVHVPVAIENLTRITFRAFSELFDDWSQVFTVLPVSADDAEIAEILTKHGNWQIRNQIKDFYRQMMRATLTFFTSGDVTGHSYYDMERKMNRHEVLTCDEFVVPYVYTTTMSDYSDVPFRIRVLNKYRHELQAMKGVWDDIQKVIDKDAIATLDDEPDSMFAEVANLQRGIEKPTEQSQAPYKLLHWEGWSDKLPNQERDRFIQAIVDKRTKRVVSLMIYEEADWQEKLRFEKETAEHQQYADAHAQHAEMIAALPGQKAALDQEAQERAAGGMPMDPTEYAERSANLDPAMIPPPVPPTWMQDHEDPTKMPDPADPASSPKPARKVPIHMFTHGVCIEPMVGNLGIGFGTMQSDFNKAANTAMSQFSDSASLGNVWGLITSGNVEFERPFSFAPGSINVAKGVTGAQLKDSIHEMKPAPANPQMREMVEMIIGWGQSSAEAPEILSGEPGKSGETRGGVMARIEQATKQLAVPTRTFAETFLGPILLNNARINAMYLAEEEVVQVNDATTGAAQELQLGRGIYDRDYRVSIGSDLRFASRQQRVDEADAVTQMASPTGPFPQLATNTPFLQRALADSLKARGKAHLIPFACGPMLPAPETPLGAPPPPPPPGPPQLDPNGNPIPPPEVPPGAPPGPPAPPPAPPGPPQPPAPPPG